MTKSLSFDTSTTKSGAAIFKDGKFCDWKLFNYEWIKDVDERTRNMCTALLSFIKEQRPDIIYIEKPKGSGKNVELVHKLSKILGVVYAYTLENNCAYEEVMPSVWRKWVSGFEQGGKSRNELKAEGIRLVKEKYGIEVPCDDVADAILIGEAMMTKYDVSDSELFE